MDGDTIALIVIGLFVLTVIGASIVNAMGKKTTFSPGATIDEKVEAARLEAIRLEAARLEAESNESET